MITAALNEMRESAKSGWAKERRLLTLAGALHEETFELDVRALRDEWAGRQIPISNVAMAD